MSGIMSMLLGAVSSAAAAADEFFNRVTLLLNTGSTNGAQNNTFLDSSSNNFSITRNGNTTQGTFTPFSQTGWSNFFNGSSDYASAGTSLFNYTTANASTQTATIEAWVYTTAYGSPSQPYYSECIIGKGDVYMNFGINGSGNLVLTHFDGTARTVTSSGTVPLNTWTYVACTISGGVVTLYINGSSSGTGTWFGIAAGGQNTASLIGRASTNASSIYFSGYLSNVRVSTNARTISTPTVAYSSDGNTALLTCQSNRFIDNSSNAIALTLTGTPSVQAFSPFAPTAAYDSAVVGGSGYFDGTGDYLSLPYSSQLQFTGDFTIEFWAYPLTQVQSAAGVINNYSSWPSSTGFAIFCGHSSASSTKWCVALFGTFPAITSTNDFIKNAWSHIALVRNGTGTNNITLYVNGVASGTTTSNNTVTGTANNWWIGTTGDTVTQTFTGYLAGLRAINSAAYTSAFTPPTAPLAAGSNKLLLNYTNAGIFDSTAKNVLETVGGAQVVSPTPSKFGNSSMYFDGTGDYLVNTSTNNPLAFGTGDFTIEFWLYLNSTGTQVILDGRNSSSSDVAPLIYYLSGLKYYTAGADRITGGTLSTGQWYYIALVKASGSTKLYINGTQTGSTYTDGNTYVQQVNRPVIGAEGVAANLGNSALNAYIDELRITKGYARTVTSNPTAAFPVQ
jgi:hypothetical protein